MLEKAAIATLNRRALRLTGFVGSRLLAAVVLAALAHADIRLMVPEESPSGPFYARIERGFVHHTDEWAAIAFYRDPSCVPPDFNLLNFFDLYGAPPRPFSCPLTVEGFEIWQNGPQSDAAPTQSQMRGKGAVPVWFVSWPELQSAMSDGRLSKAELLAQPSLLMASATYFKETLHPYGGAQQSSIEIVAQGTLPDGRSFQYQATEAAGELRHVRIEFK